MENQENDRIERRREGRNFISPECRKCLTDRARADYMGELIAGKYTNYVAANSGNKASAALHMAMQLT